MAGEPTISIKITDLQGNLKNLAKAADSDGSGVIDNAYEHSLFTQYCDAAGEDASDYTAKYSASDTKKAEKTLVKEQDYSGSTKENMANLEQYEAKWQGAMQLAFKAVRNDTESKAKLCEFIKTKPKLQNYTSMADYAAALGEKINEMSTLLEVDLKEFTQGLVDDAVVDVNAHTDKVGEQVVDVVDEWGEEMKLALEQLEQEIAEGTAVIRETVQDAQGNIIATIHAQGNRIVKCVTNAKGEIIRFVNDKGDDIMLNTTIDGIRTRMRVTDEGIATRNTVYTEGNETRRVVRQQAREEEHSEAITRNLNENHTQGTITRVNKMVQRVRNSNISPAEKDRLLSNIEKRTQDIYISDRELDALEQSINKSINPGRTAAVGSASPSSEVPWPFKLGLGYQIYKHFNEQ